MNNRQLIVMWCGIAAIVLAGLNVIRSYGLVCLYGFSVWVLMVTLAVAGLIYTFKTRQAKDQSRDVPDDIFQKRRRQLREEERWQEQAP